MIQRHTVSHAARIALVTITVVAVAACAQPPEEEMAAARQAVERAEANSDVSRYAPETIQEARQLLSDMEAAAENEEYESALSLADDARNTADQAVQDAEAAKAAARDRAQQAVATAGEALEEALTALNDARDVSGIDLDFQATAGELAAADDAVTAAESHLNGEQYPEAENTAEEARSLISDTMRHISNAVRAASSK